MSWSMDETVHCGLRMGQGIDVRHAPNGVLCACEHQSSLNTFAVAWQFLRRARCNLTASGPCSEISEGR